MEARQGSTVALAVGVDLKRRAYSLCCHKHKSFAISWLCHLNGGREVSLFPWHHWAFAPSALVGAVTTLKSCVLYTWWLRLHCYWVLGVLCAGSSFSPASPSPVLSEDVSRSSSSATGGGAGPRWLWWSRDWGLSFTTGSHVIFSNTSSNCEMMGHLRDEWAWERARLWEEMDPNPGSTVKLGKSFYHVSNCAHNSSISISMLLPQVSSGYINAYFIRLW